MKKSNILYFFLTLFFIAPFIGVLDFQVSASGVSKVKPAKKSSIKSKKGKTTKKKSPGTGIHTLYSDTVTGEWIHRGRQGIIVYCDSSGNVRAMSPSSMRPAAGRHYAEFLNNLADSLKEKGTRLYSLVAPTQGEFYMPLQIEENLSQTSLISKVAEFFSPDITPVFVSDNLKKHKGEEIYNRTDHHWAPLGAFYAAEVLARSLGLPFAPLEGYKTDTVSDYVGTMYKFSGDPTVKNNPELFIYYIAPGDYHAEYIDYIVRNGRTVEESEVHEGPVYRKFKDGSGAAYCTFFGGDTHTVRIVNHNPPNNRKLMIVKDSFGNALAPCMINSCQEVHVLDFRFFPHNIIDYVEDNGITDLVFVNCPGLAYSKGSVDKFKKLIKTSKTDSSEIMDDDIAEDNELNDDFNNY